MLCSFVSCYERRLKWQTNHYARAHFEEEPTSIQNISEILTRKNLLQLLPCLCIGVLVWLVHQSFPRSFDLSVLQSISFFHSPVSLGNCPSATLSRKLYYIDFLLSLTNRDDGSTLKLNLYGNLASQH